MSAGSEPGDLSARAMDAANHDGNVASYEGRASGMSVTRETDASGMTDSGSLRSGAFTADVQLSARFGVDPTVSGHVDNFGGGAHVKSAWHVNLETMDLQEPASRTAAGIPAPGVPIRMLRMASLVRPASTARSMRTSTTAMLWASMQPATVTMVPMTCRGAMCLTEMVRMFAIVLDIPGETDLAAEWKSIV